MQQETILQELSELKAAVNEARSEAAQARQAAVRAQRHGRARAILGTLALAASLVVVSAPQAAAQLGITLSSLSARVDALTARTAAVESKTQYMLVSGTNTIFRGTNVMVQSGSGSTDGAVNGLGNLIVGYNENFGQFGDERGGSHNLVVGKFHDYLSYSGVVFGYANASRNIYASVTGGYSNVASGAYSSVSGGALNTASQLYSSISGGRFGTATGSYSSISGGFANTESRDYGWRASSTVTN